MHRAKNTASELEIITDDGTFIKGIVECENPEESIQALKEEFEIPDELIRFDKEKERVEIAAWIIEEIHEEVNGNSFVIEEYPTADRLEVERRPL